MEALLLGEGEGAYKYCPLWLIIGQGVELAVSIPATL